MKNKVIDMPMPKLMKNIILKRDPSFGGTSVLFTGRLGSGKTSMMSHIAKRLIELQKDSEYIEYIYWRGQASCQWDKLSGIVPIQIFIHAKFMLNVFICSF